MIFTQEKKYLVMLSIIFALSLFLRMHNLANLLIFTADEEYQLTLAKTIVEHFHIIWIGVGAADSGFYLGPFWTYLTAFLLFLSKGDPLITGYVAAILGVITTGLITLVGFKLFNIRVGLISGFLYSCLPLIVFYDQRYWNVTLVPLLSLVMVLLLFLTKDSAKWWLLFAGAYGLIFHVHLSLVPVGFLAVYFFIKQKVYLNKQVSALSLLIFLIVVSPLIAFDYFHKGSNITTPIRIIKMSSDNPARINIVSHSSTLFESLGRLWYLRPFSSNADEILADCAQTPLFGNADINLSTSRTKPVFWLSLLGISLVIWFLVKKSTWKKFSTKLLALTIITITLGFLLYPGIVIEYYLLGLFPLILILPALLVDSLKGNLKYLAYYFVVLVCILGIFTVTHASDEFGLAIKKTLIQKVGGVVDASFDLKEYGKCQQYAGWRYLFTVYGKKPDKSSVDSTLGWLYPKDIKLGKLKYSVIMSESRVQQLFNIKEARVISEGGFKGFIFTNY